jgi:hypothetical protein
VEKACRHCGGAAATRTPEVSTAPTAAIQTIGFAGGDKEEHARIMRATLAALAQPI